MLSILIIKNIKHVFWFSFIAVVILQRHPFARDFHAMGSIVPFRDRHSFHERFKRWIRFWGGCFTHGPLFSQIFICRYYHKVSWHIWRVSEVKVLKVWEESLGAWEPEFSCLCISSLPFGARATDTCRYFLWKNPMVIFRDCE